MNNDPNLPSDAQNSRYWDEPIEEKIINEDYDQDREDEMLQEMRSDWEEYCSDSEI